MARIIGQHIVGSIGDQTYYVINNRQIVRKKRKLDSGKFASDPKFKRVRENCAEFGRGSSAVKLLKTALQGVLKNWIDYTMTGRLMREIMQVIKSDNYN